MILYKTCILERDRKIIQHIVDKAMEIQTLYRELSDSTTSLLKAEYGENCITDTIKVLDAVIETHSPIIYKK